MRTEWSTTRAYVLELIINGRQIINGRHVGQAPGAGCLWSNLTEHISPRMTPLPLSQL